MKKYELSYKELKESCDPDVFDFATTEDLDTSNLVYGQDRGIKALEFGLMVDIKGYNMYLEGPAGVRKNYVHKKLFRGTCKKEKSTF